jgi:hypothetical protein
MHEERKVVQEILEIAGRPKDDCGRGRSVGLLKERLPVILGFVLRRPTKGLRFSIKD